jgi:hypothetical protein
MYYLRKSFQKMREKSAESAHAAFSKEYGSINGIIEIACEPSLNEAIVVFVNSDKVKLPEVFGDYDVIIYDVRKVQTQCAALLKRMQDEKIEQTEETEYFTSLLQEGQKLCGKLEERNKTT